MAGDAFVRETIGNPLRLHWAIKNFDTMSSINKTSLTARARIVADATPSADQGSYPGQESLPDSLPDNRELTITDGKIYMELDPVNVGNFVVHVSLWGERGMLLANDVASGQKFEIASAAEDVPAVVTDGFRPGYVNDTENHLLPASAPSILDFKETSTILRDLDENEFRQKIADTILCMDNLGLNRTSGEDRAQAYLDMVTWDDAYRASWINDNSVNSSSCGMFVRNTWWLCGVRGTELFDNAYNGGVISEILSYNTDARKRWNTDFTAKTFLPKIGDVIYLYSASTNSQHIFTICGINKSIEVVDGVSTVYNDDGSLASEITFTSVDGGQADGTGPDGNKKSKTWGCQAIRKVERKMKLSNGHFLNIGNGWPFPDGKTGRPVNTWIDIWTARNGFTGNYIMPQRAGFASTSSFVSRGEKKMMFAPSAPLAAEVTKSDTEPDFYTWPTLNSLPESFIEKIISSRQALSSNLISFNPKYKGKKVQSGYSYNGKKVKPIPLYSSDDPAKYWSAKWKDELSKGTGFEDKIKAILDRFYIEKGGEGGTSAVVTGDGALFTWGSGIGFTGYLKDALTRFLNTCEAGKNALLDYGISVYKNTFMIVNTDTKTVLTNKAAAQHIDGVDTDTANPLKKLLMTAFVKVTEDNIQMAANAQWECLKINYFYKAPQPIPIDVLYKWSPEAICYVIHCSMWGTFATWPKFAETGGDLKKILSIEVNHTKFYDDKGTYKLVQPVRDSMAPSGTMLENMGHRIMIEKKCVEPLASLSDIRSGDIVFKMNTVVSKQEYYILRAATGITNPKDDINTFIANKQGLPMSDLLAAFSKVRGSDSAGYKKLQDMRDWYASDANAKKEAFGSRPRIAMDAILHRNEGSTAGWILSDCEQASISQTSCSDQYDLIKSTIGMA